MSLGKTLVKQLRPIDFRSAAGIALRGKNVYNGGTPAATVGPRRPRKNAAIPTSQAINNYLRNKLNG